VGLERDPLSLVRINEELLEWKSSGFGSKKSRLKAVGIQKFNFLYIVCSNAWKEIIEEEILKKSTLKSPKYAQFFLENSWHFET
jgi:hypothetical protein